MDTNDPRHAITDAQIRERIMYAAVRSIESELGIHATNMVFLMDKNFRIRAISRSVIDTLLYQERELVDHPLTAVLTKESKQFLDSIKKSHWPAHSCYTADLTFRSKQVFTIPAFCFFLALGQDEIIFVALATLLPQEADETKLKQAIEKFATRLKRETRISAPRISATEEERTWKVRDYIIGHLDKPIVLSDLEEEFGVNQTKLQSGFKQIFNTTIAEYIVGAKIIRACVLLKEGKTLKETAHKLSHSLAWLKATFKQKVGCSPGKYAQSPMGYAQQFKALEKKYRYNTKKF